MHPALRHGLLLTWLTIVVFPLFWIVATSFKPPQDWNAWPAVWWPSEPTLFNYIQVWVNDFATGIGTPGGRAEVIGPWGALINTFTIALISSTVATVFGAVVAYGASRYRILTDSQLLYFLLLRMVPPFVVAAPVFLWFSALGLEDTIIGLIMLYTLITVPYAMLVMKNCAPPGSARSNCDVSVSLYPELERVFLRPDPVQDRCLDPAGSSQSLGGKRRRERVPGGPVRGRNPAAHRHWFADPQTSGPGAEFRVRPALTERAKSRLNP